MRDSEAKVLTAIMDSIRRETVNLPNDGLYRVVKAVARSCEQSADALYRTSLAEYEATRPGVNGPAE